MKNINQGEEIELTVVREFLFVGVTFEQSPKLGEGSEPKRPLRVSDASRVPELSVIGDWFVSGSLIAVMRMRSNETQGFFGFGGGELEAVTPGAWGQRLQ